MSEISEGPEKVAQQGSGELSEVGIQLHEPAAEQPYRYFSLAGRITAGFLAITVLVAALSVASLELDRWFELQWWSRILIILVVALLLGRWALEFVLWFLAVATMATTVQRMVHVAAKLPGPVPRDQEEER